jgi:hypothetical protein
MPQPTIEHRSACITPDERYRYWLERRWGGAQYDSPAVIWCMLNPSTADALIDDPTIRRCIGFTDSWGFGRLVVVNLYAYRATEPAALRLRTPAERFGPDNAAHLHHWTRVPSARILVCAWGGNRLDPVPEAITTATRYALGFTANGEPLHPLYLPADLKLIRVSDAKV